MRVITFCMIVASVMSIQSAIISQTAGPAGNTFDAASIKLSSSERRGWDGGPGSKTPGRYSFHGATLQDLIAVAYGVRSFQISSKLPLDAKRYDLDVKLPSDTTKDVFRLMMRALLKERFRLDAHSATKEFSGFLLKAVRSGPQLAVATDHPHVDNLPDLSLNQPGITSRQVSKGRCTIIQVKGRQQTTSELVRWMESLNEGLIRDATGLAGEYDFTLEYAREVPDLSGTIPDASVGCDAPNLFTALQEQLGLQLVRQMLPFEIIIVDSVGAAPTPN